MIAISFFWISIPTHYSVYHLPWKYCIRIVIKDRIILSHDNFWSCSKIVIYGPLNQYWTWTLMNFMWTSLSNSKNILIICQRNFMVYTCFNETDQSFLTNNLHNYTSLKFKGRIDGCTKYLQCADKIFVNLKKLYSLISFIMSDVSG